MEQFEKVCKGLDCFVNHVNGPYLDDCRKAECEYIKYGDCEMMVMSDALSLIRQQQERIRELEAAHTARVMTLEEIKDGESYWLSAGKEFVTLPVICVHREDDARKPYITFVWQFGTFSWDSEDYGKRWCCWTQQPTEEQRKAEKFDG